MKKLYLLLPVVFLFLKANAQQNVFDWGRSANNNNLSINGGFGECVTGAIDINKNVVGAGFDLEGVLIFGSDTINTTICPVAAFFLNMIQVETRSGRDKLPATIAMITLLAPP